MNLNKEQYIAANHVNGPMFVLAGPGSGKTHLLVERIRIMIEEKGIDPANILVITFSKKAARQMKSRFERRIEGRSYPVTFGTFHAVFYDILKKYDPNIKRLITEEEQKLFLVRAIRSLPLASDLFANEDNINEILGIISAFKNFGDSFYENSEAGRGMDINERSDFRMVHAAYTDLVGKSHMLDFDDMIIRCRDILYKHEGLLRMWQKKYRYFLVDEFQDINEAQYDVLRLLAGDERNVFAVGDDDQSIYAFRGSRPELMKKFIHQYVGCRRVTLTMNYRCCENVIGAADTVIRHNVDRIERPMQRHLPSKEGGEVLIVNSESTDVQAEYVCDMIEALTQEYGYDAGDIAVLYRSEHCARLFVNTAKKRGIDLMLSETGENVSMRDKIHEAYIRAHEGRALRRDIYLIMNNPARGLSREALLQTGGDYIGDLRAYYENDPEKLAAISDLEDMIEGYSKETGIGKKPGPAKKEFVQVMTAHASKGLEFKCVFIIGLQEGLFPHHRNMTGNAEEERRLMYVAMTRAKERLCMCTVSTDHGKRPSRFAVEAAKENKYIKDQLSLRRI